ncbi:hypothetical protein EV586_103242 [Tumebacillus sp. BK434]|uniref:hypothetical protein n=1 Tax=Tumebacillus sp. BK434 TaxID=2512169 RepID=UPI001053B2FA|nr:hypothetical protein [Tumebacillus sp. BK434]TCP55589.1 hypothetical protein EV586_103242 [Tumebacillus sp. BK434]
MYQTGDFGQLIVLFLLMMPVLLFLGYHLAKLAYGDREHAEPTDVVVMPHDLAWMQYTSDINIITEISRVVIRLRQEPPVTYEQIKPLLETYEAHKVAQAVGVFHVYREQAIRDYLRTVQTTKAGAQLRPHL